MNKKTYNQNIVKCLFFILYLVDAFAALGGNPDCSGSIRKDTILDILKEEFELIFDLEDLLDRIEIQADNLNFSEFKKLFRISDDPKALSRTSTFF